MACGVVPVATRVGGVPELITDGEDGFLEAVGDIEAQAARVVSLLTDDELHYRMAKAGRWNAGERFCTDRIIPQRQGRRVRPRRPRSLARAWSPKARSWLAVSSRRRGRPISAAAASSRPASW